MFRKILCPVDLSEFSDEILSYAKEVAKGFNSELIVLTVIPTLEYYVPYESFIIPDNILQMKENLQLEVEKDMERLIGSIDYPAKKMIRWGIPHNVILDIIREEEIELVVMGTHGRSGIEHLILGSVAEKIIRKSPCPVLIVRPKRKS